MQLSHHHNILELRHSKDSHAIETPIKKSKPSSHSDLKTAESPNMQFSASKNSIADVEAEELFDNFSRIVTISESNEEDEY